MTIKEECINKNHSNDNYSYYCVALNTYLLVKCCYRRCWNLKDFEDRWTVEFHRCLRCWCLRGWSRGQRRLGGKERAFLGYWVGWWVVLSFGTYSIEVVVFDHCLDWKWIVFLAVLIICCLVIKSNRSLVRKCVFVEPLNKL